jgi:nicotinamidase-related amidase
MEVGVIYDIVPGTTAVLLVDPQREYFDDDKPLFTPNAASIKANLVALRDAARSAGALSVLVLHEHKKDGSNVGRMGDFDPTPVFEEGTPGVEPIPELGYDADLVLKKSRYSAFVGTDLHDLLQARGIDTVIVTGLMTNFCCVSTARSAHDLDYKTVFVADACSGPDMPDLGYGELPHTEVMKGVATSLAAGVADVVTTSEILEKLR